ncbi:uncharacterized protein LOC103716725 [Phoenix dactylifera]|uniref:Uncharacterized protein LOC103716725 n=1 Tax=Phoenix dactylifera TaxID=42345 RepID=A0A8B7CNP6_PHODC|nr:uncharacterized protein LOC103716725 [Phoenix dactylifera]
MHPPLLSLRQSFPFSPKISASTNPHSRRQPNSTPSFPVAGSIPSPPPLLSLRRPRCSAGDGEGREEQQPSRAKDVLSGMVGERVEELLRREENRALLDGLEEASRRVDRARQALADIEKQEAEALRAKEYVRQLESRELEIAESQRDLLEARTMVEEAERSLSSDIDENNSGDVLPEEIDQNVERLESLKAASISSVAGMLAGLPIYLYQATSFSQLLLHLATVFISCALFGVTFRYAIRRDLDNIQLKTGAPAAFGFVRGLAALDAGKPLELNNDSFIAYSIDGAVYVLEDIFIFLSAAIALDFCFKMRLLSPFPIRK